MRERRCGRGLGLIRGRAVMKPKNKELMRIRKRLRKLGNQHP
jgi:hypothetical protein